MLLGIIGVGVILGLVIVGFYGALRWATGFATNDLVARLQAGESIVNRDCVPEPWLAPYRRRIGAMQKAGTSQEDIDKVGLKAREHCLRMLDDLIKFYARAGVVDTADTREVLIEALQKQRERWRTLDWRKLFWPDDRTEPAP